MLIKICRRGYSFSKIKACYTIHKEAGQPARLAPLVTMTLSSSTKPVRQTRLKLNSRLLPGLVILLLVMQLAFPYKGWVILLVGFGSVWGLGYLWARQLARHLSFQREIRFGWAHVGDRLEERFTLTNGGLATAAWVEVIDETHMPNYSASRVTGVGGYSQNRWHTEGVCTQRGLFTLGPTTLYTGDPFGIYTVSLHHPDSATLTVTPPIVPLPHIEVAPGGRAGEGRHQPNVFERTVSSASVRSYSPGDSFHWIHWPTTARQGDFYVRLFDSMPSGDWWIIVDLDQAVQVGQGLNSTGEHSIILAVSLADRGLRAGRSVGLAGYGQQLIWLPPESSDTQRQRILRELALARPGSLPLADLLTQSHPALNRLASLIIITAAVDRRWVEAVLPLLRRGAVATVLLLDPVAFGGQNDSRGIAALLTNLAINHYLIPPDLLNQPQIQAEQQGRWDWRVSPSGRAVARRRPQNESWQTLA